jgi:DNA replication protein DnaC
VTAAMPAPPPLDDGLDQLLRRMRLPHMRRLAPEVIATAKAQRWDPAEVLRALLAEEVAGRDRSSLATRRARAAFPTGKTFDAWDERLSSVPAPTQAALRTPEWVGRPENLVVCGPSGTGKTFLLEALGQAAVEDGKHVAWFTLEQLGMVVRSHRADDSVTKAIARILRADLVVVDDIELLPVGPDAAEGLYRLVDAAYERRSVAVSSNLHPSAFDELMPKTLATATVDRLMHHAGTRGGGRRGGRVCGREAGWRRPARGWVRAMGAVAGRWRFPDVVGGSCRTTRTRAVRAAGAPGSRSGSGRATRGGRSAPIAP